MSHHPFRVGSASGASSEQFATLFAPDVTFHSPILTKSVNGKALVLRMRSAPEKPDNKYTMPYAASRFVTP